MVTIFVDTNILYDDPFLKGTNSYLLELAGSKDVQVIFSKIVIKEASEILMKRLKELINDYKISQSKLRKNSRLLFTAPLLERSAIVKDFEQFFENLYSKRIIQILPTTANILELALEDLLNKKPPFFDNKNELKDCLIWYTYVSYALETKGSCCILLTNNIRDFGNNKGELHQSLSSSKANFKLIRNISDLKLELGEIPALTDSQRTSNSLSEIKINQVFQKKQIDVLIEHLNGAISEYYKYRDFEFTVHANLRLIQLADLEVLTLTAQPGSEDDNLQEFFGTVTANLKIEIYETSSRRIMNGCRINLVEVFNKPFLFDFEVILNDKDYIEHLEISNLSEIHESLEEYDLPF